MMIMVNYGFTDSNNIFMSNMSWFHDYINSYLIGILFFVMFYFFFLMIFKFFVKIENNNNLKMESLMAFFPIMILLLQVVPSLYLIYSSSMLDTSPDLTIKITGHQWYWHYELSDLTNLDFDMFMKSSDSLKIGETRLLDVDNSIILPVNSLMRLCVTSSDVIHSWTLSGIGVKMDAIPGIINSLTFKMSFTGIFYGQCSEICGSNHSFMPICVESSTWDKFYYWLMNF